MGSSTNEAVQENLALSLGEFFAQANASSREAELKAKEQMALAEELALVKMQLANQAQTFFIRKTALTQELSALQQAELEANKKLHDKGQEYTTLLVKLCHYVLRWWKTPTPQGLKILSLRLSLSILRWTFPPSRRRTTSLMDRLCQSVLKRKLLRS